MPRKLPIVGDPFDPDTRHVFAVSDPVVATKRVTGSADADSTPTLPNPKTTNDAPTDTAITRRITEPTRTYCPIGERSASAPIGSYGARTTPYSSIVTTFGSTSVRPLGLADVDGYLRHVREVDAGSGVHGAAHSHAYSQSEPFDMEAGRDREVTRWSTEIEDLAWRRAWGLFDQSELVGHVYLAGGMLRSEMHRVHMGTGIRRSHHRRGGGTLLLQTGIEWAQKQSTIDWIDLGVFSDNPGAQALYARHGFQILGRTPDRFRVDGQSLDDISMTLTVARDNE
jgi:RimJ/RimL family protein N-acetyltransferase